MPIKRDAKGKFVAGSGSKSKAKAAKIVDKDMGWRAFAASIHKAAKKPQRIDVGIFVREVAVYALANEFGTSKIPSRPWFRNTIDANRAKYVKMMRAAGLRVGKNLSPADALIPVANEMRNDLIKAIQGWKSPPNAPRTVAKKGFNAPLVMTGQMQRVLTWLINGGMGGGKKI